MHAVVTSLYLPLSWNYSSVFLDLDLLEYQASYFTEGPSSWVLLMFPRVCSWVCIAGRNGTGEMLCWETHTAAVPPHGGC